jgi:hypothetical protein
MVEYERMLVHPAGGPLPAGVPWRRGGCRFYTLLFFRFIKIKLIVLFVFVFSIIVPMPIKPVPVAVMMPVAGESTALVIGFKREE